MHQKDPKMSRTLLCLPVALAITALPVLAHAAEEAAPAPAMADPFEDYEATHPQATKVAAVKPPPEEKTAAKTDEDILVPWKKGSLMAGLGATFSYTSSSNEVVSGADASNSNLFMRLQLHGAYNLIDKLQVGGAIGMMRKSLGREAGENATETDFFLEAQAFYTVPIIPRFAFMPGLGMGLYFGGSDRKLYIQAPAPLNTVVSTTETTSTFGAHATLYALLAYQLSPMWQLRTGLSFSGLVGSESVDSANKSLSTSAFNVGLPIQLNMTFK